MDGIKDKRREMMNKTELSNNNDFDKCKTKLKEGLFESLLLIIYYLIVTTWLIKTYVTIYLIKSSH